MYYFFLGTLGALLGGFGSLGSPALLGVDRFSGYPSKALLDPVLLLLSLFSIGLSS